MGYQLMRRLQRYEDTLKKIASGGYEEWHLRDMALDALHAKDPEDGTQESHDALSKELAKIMAKGMLRPWQAYMPEAKEITNILSPMITEQTQIDAYMIKTCIRETMEALGHDPDMTTNGGGGDLPVWERIAQVIHSKMNEDTGRAEA